MKRYGTLLSAFVFAMSLFGAAACQGGGGGCGGETEESLDEEAKSKTQVLTTTCGGGTHLEGNVCVKNASSQTQKVTTLGSSN